MTELRLLNTLILFHKKLYYCNNLVLTRLRYVHTTSCEFKQLYKDVNAIPVTLVGPIQLYGIRSQVTSLCLALV